MQNARQLLAALAFLTTSRISAMADADIPIIITRKQALALGLKRYFSGISCKRGHVSHRYVSDRSCAECKINKEKTNIRKQYRKLWNLENKEHRREWRKSWVEKNPNYGKIKYSKNKVKIRELAKKNRVKYAARIIAANKFRKHLQKFRVPLWANKKEIEKIYRQCRIISKSTGFEHHVDHVIPLKGENVSGLHVETNLQIISATENLSKKNKFSE